MGSRFLNTMSTILIASVIFCTIVFAYGKQNLDKDEVNIYKVMELQLNEKAENIRDKIVFTNQSGKVLPYFLNQKSSKNYLILPMYDESEKIHMRINLNPKNYTLKNTEEVICLDNEQNMKEFETYIFKYDRSIIPKSDADLSDGSVKGEQNLVKLLEPSHNKIVNPVEGVDEGDIVKTDGSHICYILDQRIAIAQIKEGAISIKKLISLPQKIVPLELYFDKNRLTIVGQDCHNQYPYDDTVIIVYDVSDALHPKKIREVVQAGHYVSSYKNGNYVHVVTQSILFFQEMLLKPDEEKKTRAGIMEETLNDSTVVYDKIPYDKIMIFPGSYHPNMVTVSSFSIYSNKRADQFSYIGEGKNIYLSKTDLIISHEGYEKVTACLKEDVLNRSKYELKSDKIISETTTCNLYTYLYRFRLEETNPIYVGTNKVKGILLNQASMDEYKGALRVAHVKTKKKENVITVFDKNMKEIGYLDRISTGEKMSSVHFMKDRAYFVTFKESEPFFVIDLKNPKSPKTLGYLKIPGYSTCLHPIDKTHILGFGHSVKKEDGRIVNDAFKVAVFDVTNVAKPVVCSEQLIEQNGPYSELNYLHKALLYHPSKKYFGFPLTITSVGDLRRNTMQVDFQGAYLYQIMPNYQLQKKGQITHTDGPKNIMEYDRQIERLVYVDDVVYAISHDKISSHKDSSLEQIDSKYWTRQLQEKLPILPVSVEKSEK